MNTKDNTTQLLLPQSLQKRHSWQLTIILWEDFICQAFAVTFTDAVQLPMNTKKPHYLKSIIVSFPFDWGPIQVNLYGLYQAIITLSTGASLY